MAPSAVPSKPCFICELDTASFVANSRETILLLGVALNITAALDEVIYPGDERAGRQNSNSGDSDVVDASSSDYRNLMLLTLDDGSGEF